MHIRKHSTKVRMEFGYGYVTYCNIKIAKAHSGLIKDKTDCTRCIKNFIAKKEERLKVLKHLWKDYL